MKYILIKSIFAIALLFAATACGNGEQTAEETMPDQPVYEVKGRFISLNETDSYFTVVHEEIPGVMMAMRMGINLKDISEADGFERGDIVQFNLKRDGMSWFGSDLTKLPDDTVLNLPERLQTMGLD